MGEHADDAVERELMSLCDDRDETPSEFDSFLYNSIFMENIKKRKKGKDD